MPKIKKTIRNPYGLSTKQKLVIEDVAENIKAGKGLTLTASHKKIYQTKNPAVLANENINRPNFRLALIEGLKKRKILGPNSIVEQKLSEGLDANFYTKSGIEIVDHRTRLAYIQEINKIADVYAPSRTEQKTLSLNLTMTKEELDEKIKSLQTQLST
jgi:hypothetical protein